MPIGRLVTPGNSGTSFKMFARSLVAFSDGYALDVLDL